MSYVGNTLQNQNYVPAIDYFNGDGSTTAFTLSRPVASVAAVQATISNVPQNPGSAFTVLNSTITFTSAPPAGTGNIYVYYTSPNTTVAVLPQSPVISGDLTTTGGHYAIGAFNSGYTDGIVMDYTTGTGRITVGGSDGVSFYNGTPSARNLLFGSDSSGNVGIGTSSPSQKLTVSSGSNDVASIISTGDTNADLYLKASGTTLGNVRLRANGNDMVFIAGLAERMRIDSSGKLLVGTTSTSGLNGGSKTVFNESTAGNWVGDFVNTAGSAGDGGIQVYAGDGSTSPWLIQAGTTAGTAKFRVVGNGNATNSNNSWGALSDQRLKENIADATPKLDALCQVQVRNFNLIGDEQKQIGVVAQELEQVFPGMVEEDREGYKSVKYSVFVPMLIKAIQELKAEVDDLKAQLKGAA